jgi:hypothetical protein
MADPCPPGMVRGPQGFCNSASVIAQLARAAGVGSSATGQRATLTSASIANSIAPGVIPVLARAAGGITAAAGASGVVSRAVQLAQRLVPGGATGLAPAQCPPGTFKGPLGTCVDLIPGGATSGGGIFIGRGDPVMGMFGAGVLPARMNRTVHACPAGLVLGKDNICYPKSVVGKKGRKWNPGMKPPITGGDVAAIRRADRARGRVMSLGKDVGLYVAKKRPTSCAPKRKR